MKPSTRVLAVSAIVGAVYAVLTVALAPVSYGTFQFRLSEALCIMPYFIPGTAWGLFVGCMCANLLTGNIFDIVFGSLATLLAGLLVAQIGKRPHSFLNSVFACFMPVVINALVIGAVLTKAYNGVRLTANAPVFLTYAMYVAIGEAVVMYIPGLILIRRLPKMKFFTDFLITLNTSGDSGRR